MEFHPLEVFENCSNLSLCLPRFLFSQKKREFESANYQEKGIITELFFSLWLRRIYQQDSSWELESYDPVDFHLPYLEIDVKTTGRDCYSIAPYQWARAIDLAYTNGISFAFVLVSISDWHFQSSTVEMQIHEALVIRPNGKIERIPYQGGTKYFEIGRRF